MAGPILGKIGRAGYRRLADLHRATLLHPVNAILNCAYSVAAAQLTRALAASGLDPAAGYLHQPKDLRASLSYDALELLRADIDTRILSLLASRIWQRSDFLVPPHGIVRLTPSLARTVMGRALRQKAIWPKFATG